MAVPGTIQALIAAFSFGILFNAALAALVLHAKSHGSAIYRDGLRLVLILFLLSSSLWALVEFLSTLINPSAGSVCQVAVVFSSLFDQFGRVFIEQYLAWAVQKGDVKSVLTLVPQILVWGRLLVGIAFVAVTRPGFNPTCVPMSSVRAVSVTAVGLDAVIIGMLSIRAFTKGPAKTTSTSTSTSLQTMTVRLVSVGLAVWMGTSVTLQLGLESLDLFYKTALPGIGLTLLVLLVTVFFQTLGVPRVPLQRSDSPFAQDQSNRDLSSSDSAAYPPSRYEDVKAMEALSVSTIMARRETSRGIKRNGDGTFPMISRPMTAGSDSNTMQDQEQNFSQVPLSEGLYSQVMAVPPLPSDWEAKVRKGQKSSESKTNKGRLNISHPIINEETMGEHPLRKIPTIDLAEAANQERLRREKYAQRNSALVASRPAPQPPSAPTRSDIVITRREVPESLGRSESLKTVQSQAPSRLSVEGQANSTATQLSPGVEAIRRRSPRQPESQSMETPFTITKPGEPIRIPIPRPIEPSRDIPPPMPEPTKTPLQRRPTTGLPSNPRAQAMKSLAQEAQNQRQQTVMFVNDIVYEDPHTVQDIVQDAGKAWPPDSANSVVNRPRPIPRKVDKDRQVFPAEIAQEHGHRRSRSAGSLLSRKSILKSTIGSPDKLPSLPPLPPILGSTQRPLPNDTTSMTFDEKINILYAAPTSAPSDTRFSTNVRSPIPELPIMLVPLEKPESRISEDNSVQYRGDSAIRASEASKMSTTRTSSIFQAMGFPEDNAQNNEAEFISTQFNPTDDLGKSWLPGISFDARTSDRLLSGEVKRRSSQVMPLSKHASMSTTRSDTRTTDDDDASNWVSVHSPIAPVLRQNARSTYIRKDGQNPESFGEIQIMMPGLSLEETDGYLESMYSEDDESHYDAPTTPRQHYGQNLGNFHRRVGDTCPTFSTREDKTRSRKDPPAPLFLSKPAPKRAIIIQTTEPSPIEPPEEAYNLIQAQLNKIEQSDRQSMGTPGRRLALLDNLEQEMGQLQSKWQSAHGNVNRDSLLSSNNSRPASSVLTLSAFSSQRSSVASIIAERRASRRSRMEGSGEDRTLTPSSQNSSRSSASTQATLWQTRLAEAQMKYMEHAPELLVKRNNVSFLSVSKAALGSPSPPDSEESDEETQSIYETIASQKPQVTVPNSKLWTASVPIKRSSISWLWDAQLRETQQSADSRQPPGLSIRPSPRKPASSLSITSSQLWQKPVKTPLPRPWGLWRKETTQKASTRPTTVRPPRKNKRMTILPDIIENPEPLPNKRGTLGIFQFPGGEKSEYATIYRPSQVFIAMPGTMTTGRSSRSIPVAREQQEVSEYTSSFFDEYEEEEEGDNFSDFGESDDEDGDDDFDETTLWEIASLLKTDQVPSKFSLLPMSSQYPPSENTSILADYVEDLPSGEDNNNACLPDAVYLPEDPVPIEEPVSSRTRSSELLWTICDPATEEPSQRFGLPQPAGSWSMYSMGPVRSIMKAKPRSSIAEIETPGSDHLWEPSQRHTVKLDGTSLWTLPVRMSSASCGLWTRPKQIIESRGIGLYDPTHARRTFRRTSKLPAAILTVSRPRFTKEPMPTLTSNILWAPQSSRRSAPPHSQIAVLWQNETIQKSDGHRLFSLNKERKEYRTTSAEPAALNMVRKPRVSRQPVQTLRSNHLWSKKWQKTHGNMNWIAISTIRSTDPLTSMRSSADPLTESAIDDISLEKAKTLEPAVNAASKKTAGGILSGWFSKKGGKEVPVVVASHETGVTTNTSKKVPAKETDNAKQNNLGATQRLRNRTNLANSDDWDTALADAIAASYLKLTIKGRPALIRTQATPRDWSVALHEAILESYPDLRYSRGQQFPGQWDLHLEKAQVIGHLGYDVQHRHPVFFGSLESSAEIVHPALTGYRVNPKSSVAALWAQSSFSIAAPSRGLWAPRKQASLRSYANAESPSWHGRIRSSSKTRSSSSHRSTSGISYSTQTQGLWKRGGGDGMHLMHPSKREKNWLHDSVNKRFTKIELRY
ncbi:hypothetical protein GGR57DRAFT_91539 [Xylariaceae sp. FL1272]|nr:hypothetical protein GGR57DRAFT_91539 [Xylariaceae sp. FL1272]